MRRWATSSRTFTPTSCRDTPRATPHRAAPSRSWLTSGPTCPKRGFKRGDNIAGLLGNPRPGGMGGDTSQPHPSAPDLDDKQHIQSLQEHRVDGEEVARQDAGRLAA